MQIMKKLTYKRTNIKMRLMTVLFCVLFFIRIVTAQNAQPLWDYEVAELGYTSVFQEFGSSQNYLLVNKLGSSYDPGSRIVILDNDGQEILSNDMNDTDLNIIWQKAYYDAEKDCIRLFGLGYELGGISSEKSYLTTTEVYSDGTFSSISSLKLTSNLGYRTVGYYYDEGQYKIVASSGWNVSHNQDNPTYFELSFVDMDQFGNVSNMTYIENSDICQCILPSVFDDGYQCPGFTGINLDKNLNFKSYEANRSNGKLDEARWPNYFYLQQQQSCFPWANNTYLVSNTMFGDYQNYRDGNTAVLNYTPVDYRIIHGLYHRRR